MQSIKRLLVLCLVLVSLLCSLLPLSFASACGGFFCSNVPIDQNAERIIFVVDRRVGTTTAVIGINYVGDADQFSWVLPVPDVPKLDVAQTASLDILDSATTVQINPPPDRCQWVFPEAVGFGGGGGGGDYLQTGEVGPYDYAIIKNEQPGELITWLRNNGYRVTKAMEPIIGEYVKERMYFVAMRLKRDKDVTDIQPIVLTYKSVEPMIPIKLTAIAAVPDMPVLTWIFSDTQFVPKNFAHPSVDFSGFKGRSEVAAIGQGYSASFFFSALPQYSTELKRLQEQYHGLAFVTQYAQPSKMLADLIQEDELLSKLIAEHSYVTRLRAQMSPNQMTLDPYFIASATTLPDVSNIIELDQHVDPLDFWGCSSRTAIDESLRASIPPAHTHFNDTHFDVAHPAGWVLSHFQIDDQAVSALAPVSVDKSSIDAFFKGRNTIPMFIFAPIKTWDAEVSDPSEKARFLELLKHAAEDIPSGKHILTGTYYPSISNYDSLDHVEGIRFGLLVGSTDWSRNQTMYEAMMAYVNSHAYYTRSDFRHTLFLDAGNLGGNISLQIPFPDGWIDRTDASGDVVITPADVKNIDEGPTLRLTHERFNMYLENGDPDPSGWDKMKAWATEFYNLPSSTEWPQILSCADTPHYVAIPFKNGNRTGYVVVTQQYVASVYAPAANWQRYKPTLTVMIQAFISGYCAPG